MYQNILSHIKQISNFTGIEKTQVKSSCIRRIHYVYCKGGEEDFLTDEGGGLLNFFSPLIKKGSTIWWIFLIKEDLLNNSMLEDSLLAYLLYKYTLYRTFIINNYYKSEVFLL